VLTRNLREYFKPFINARRRCGIFSRNAAVSAAGSGTVPVPSPRPELLVSALMGPEAEKSEFVASVQQVGGASHTGRKKDLNTKLGCHKSI